MAKIPKGLRKNLRSGRGARQLRRAKRGRGGGNMERMMQQMGIDMDQVDATEVIIRCPDKEIRIASPQVSVINQQGQEIYQVIGNSEEVPLEAETESEAREAGAAAEEEEMEPLTVEIRPEDKQLVMAQTGCTEAQAERALQDAEGEIARAIMDLKTRGT